MLSLFSLRLMWILVLTTSLFGTTRKRLLLEPGRLTFIGVSCRLMAFILVSSDSTLIKGNGRLIRDCMFPVHGRALIP